MSYLQVKKEVTKDRSSSPIQWVFTRISPRISPVLCSPASRPKKRPFNTKPLGDKHCLQGIQSGPRPQTCLKIDGPKNIRPTVPETGFLFNRLWAGKKTLILRQHPKSFKLQAKWQKERLGVEKWKNKTNSEWHRVQRKHMDVSKNSGVFPPNHPF